MRVQYSIAMIVTFMVLGSLMTGCVSAPVKAKSHVAGPEKAAVSPYQVSKPSGPAEGSLWCDNSAMLYMDPKAHRVGDTVTVLIVENTSSQMDANTNASRSSTIDGGVTHLLGYMRALEAKNPNLGKDIDGAMTNKLFQADLSNKFAGKGSSDRSGRITASIGARIVERLANGNLVVFGRREMKVNNEVQYITVSGIVRPTDIEADNRVRSTYIADARIEYIGQGIIADKQRPGWGTRFIDTVWPF
jgi:flagellar L-ring protein FlgH